MVELAIEYKPITRWGRAVQILSCPRALGNWHRSRHRIFAIKIDDLAGVRLAGSIAMESSKPVRECEINLLFELSIRLTITKEIQ